MDGTTALGLVKVAEEIGFETRAIKADMTLFDLPRFDLSFVLAHAPRKGKLLHYYVVIGQDKSIFISPIRSWCQADQDFPLSDLRKDGQGQSLYGSISGL